MTLTVPMVIKASAATIKSITNIVQHRSKMRTIELLENNGITLSQVRKSDPYYVGCLLRTIEAIERASRQEKVELLLSFYTSCEKANVMTQQPDSYQEVLGLLEDMSYTELNLIYLLEKNNHPYTYDAIDPKKQEEVSKRYQASKDAVSKAMGLDHFKLSARMARLTRTGLIETLSAWDSNVYYLTPLYKELKRFVTFHFEHA